VEHLLEQLRSQHLIARADGIGIAWPRLQAGEGTRFRLVEALKLDLT
jgi:hypothetical protein